MRDCRLECVQAVIERQKRMPAEANDDRLFLDRQHRRSRFLWSRPSVHDRAARLPLAHRLLIDAVTSGERSQALFTMLYRSTVRLSRRGAPVKNLAHSASFDSCNKNAPSKCGTKHLAHLASLFENLNASIASWRVLPTINKVDYTCRSHRAYHHATSNLRSGNSDGLPG